MKYPKYCVSAGMRHWFHVSCVLSIGAQLSVAAFAAGPATLVLNDTNEAPFTTPAGDGFLDVIAGEAFKRAGLQLKLVKLPAERALLNANAGIEDGDLTRIAGLEKDYPNLVRVPEKLVDWTFMAFTRQAKVTQASWANLEPLMVGHIKGWKIYEKNLRPATQIATAGDPEQLFTMLDKGRIDVALYERWLGYALAKQMNITNVQAIEPPLAVREMFIYLNQRHADKVPVIAAALRAIKAEGMYSKVCREKIAPLATPASQCDIK
ncbi:MAG: transporter substrate-binding domain-containing protein [Gammaproteobacteria bacterium]|nr:transporter substrate-binding domain-containing protein [Gammaproteobacteria bacterium]